MRLYERSKWSWFLLGISISFHIFAVTLSAHNLAIISRVSAFYGERAGLRVRAWQTLLLKERHASVMSQLNAVNQFFNQMVFISDERLWGEKDYWETPYEFLGAGGGDCEDFSVAKYFSLLQLGIPDYKLRLVYVKALTLNEFHMVVAYYPTPSSIPLILDNLIAAIKPANERPDLLPIYSFNGSKLWIIKQQGETQLVGNADRLSLWDDLQQRMNSGRFKRPIIDLDE